MALANGVIFPIFSIFLSKMLTVLLKIQTTANPLQEDLDNIKLYALLFLILGISAFVLTTIQMTCFTYVGEEITRKIRI